MGDKKFANDPLLFINQPNIAHPKAPMQSYYVTRRKEEDVSTETEEREQSPTPVKKAKIQSTTFQKNAPELSDEEENSSNQPKKQFKEMTIEEKINYFVETHRYAPKVKCEVRTNRRNYQGFIIDFEDDHVIMQGARGTRNIQISFSEIKDIRMIGFS